MWIVSISSWSCSSFGLYKYWVRLKQCSSLCFRFCWVVQGCWARSFRVFDNKWLGGGRRDDQSVFLPPPGLTVSVLLSVLALRTKNKIVVVVNTREERGKYRKLDLTPQKMTFGEPLIFKYCIAKLLWALRIFNLTTSFVLLLLKYAGPLFEEIAF